MSWHEDRDIAVDAVRAGIAVAFFLFGASVVAGLLLDAGSPARLVLALSAPVTAALAGVVTCRSARGRGGRR